MDTGVCNANLSALQNSKAPAPMPVSPSTEELFSDVESLQCLDLEAPKSHGQWESLIEKILQHPSQSSPGSWPSELSQENCETHVGFFSGWSASTVCSTNSDDSGEKDLSLCRIKSTQVGKKVCSMSKTRQSRQKRSLPSDRCSGRQSQGKPGAKKLKKPSLVVKSNSEQLPQIEQNLSAARNAAEESNFMGLPSGKGAHIWIERERRKKMSCMFSSLQSLLPNLSPKADKSSVIDEAIAYIQSLEVTLQQLSDQAEVKNGKARTAPLASADQTHHSPQACDQSSPEGVEEMNLSFQTLSSPNAMLIVCGADGFATVSCSNRLSSLELLFSALENENLNVLNAHISTSGSKRFFNIHTKAAKCPDACMGSFEAAFKALSKCLS